MATPATSNPNLRPGMTYGMRQCKRYVTVHDEAGKSRFGPEPELQYRERVGYALARSYALSTVPANLAGDQDVTSYLSDNEDENITSFRRAGKQMTIPGGASMLCVDLGPGCQSVMHRTVSVDFVIVTEGEIELELDSGETRLLYSGDTIVQRSTMHRWRNRSDKGARFIGITLAADNVEVGGQKIEEVYNSK